MDEFASLVSMIETIAVIGAGMLGRGIARDAVFGGYKTILEDISRKKLEESAAWIRRACAELNKSKATLTTTGILEDAVREADLIIEAVPDEMEMKIELFTIFDKFAKPDAILASSTPSLSIGEMAAVTFCRERCIGIRFTEMKSGLSRLRLVITPDTSQETITACCEVARRMGKETVLIQENELGGGSDRKLKCAAV